MPFKENADGCRQHPQNSCFFVCRLGLYCLENKCLQMTHLILYMLVNSLLHQETIFFNECILLNLSCPSGFCFSCISGMFIFGLLGAKIALNIPLPCNADLFLLYSPCFIVVLTWTKYSVWDTFYTRTKSWGLRCTIWYSTISGKNV